MMRARDLTTALGGHWHGQYGMACCPAHEDRSPSLSIADGDSGKLLLTCFAGCSFDAIRSELMRHGLWNRSGFVQVGDVLQRGRVAKLSSEKDNSEVARSLWERAAPITHSPAEAYLRGRGITCELPLSLRYLRDCKHPNGSAPALLAKLSGASGFAIHRTYLAPDGAGKSAFSPNKMMLGSVKGGAVHLSPPSDRLVVAEGIETALSLMCGLIDGPAAVWAALSAGNMEALILPPSLGSLIIAADGDEPGRRAAARLAERARMMGWEVSLMAAPEGRDWNDVLRQGQTEAAQ